MANIWPPRYIVGLSGNAKQRRRQRRAWRKASSWVVAMQDRGHLICVRPIPTT